MRYGKSDMQLRNHMRGVTLIELMIVVVVVSILAAFAYPNYQEFTARAKRNEARAALLRMATNQERFYLNNNTFSGTLSDVGFGSNITETGYYQLAITSADASNFTATATYRHGGKESSKCLTFTIDGRGSKTSDPETDCWTRKR